MITHCTEPQHIHHNISRACCTWLNCLFMAESSISLSIRATPSKAEVTSKRAPWFAVSPVSPFSVVLQFISTSWLGIIFGEGVRADKFLLRLKRSRTLMTIVYSPWGTQNTIVSTTTILISFKQNKAFLLPAHHACPGLGVLFILPSSSPTLSHTWFLSTTCLGHRIRIKSTVSSSHYSGSSFSVSPSYS